MAATVEESNVLAIEIFAAKDSHRFVSGIFMSVPCKCGLREADTLKIIGLKVVALSGGVVLALGFPVLTEEYRKLLVALSKAKMSLPVAEFMARGLYDSYFLKVIAE